MDYFFAPPPVPSLPVIGDTRRFPVRRIFCIGRNYAAHAKEMGATAGSGRPTFFTKPSDAIGADDHAIPYPSATALLHHEVEMVVALARGGRDIAPVDVASRLFGHAVGLDLTRRDLQADMKAQGLPWDIAKGVDHGAPVSALLPVARGRPGPDTVLSLRVNGRLRQSAPLANMLWSVPEMVAELSKLFELKAGDLVFTGTPAGVDKLLPGDSFHAELGQWVSMDGRIVKH